MLGLCWTGESRKKASRRGHVRGNEAWPGRETSPVHGDPEKDQKFTPLLPITPVHGLPTAGKVHPDEPEVRAGAGPAAHSAEPDGHHAGAGHQSPEPDHSTDPKAHRCGSAGTGGDTGVGAPVSSHQLLV